MSVVVVTGCSGYIGSRLLRFLDGSEKVSRVIGLDLKECPNASPKLEFHRLDVRDASLAGLFERERVDTVVHLAFILNPLHDTALMHDIDVNGARNVMVAAAACGARHVVVASSSSAFGAFPDNPDWLAESDLPRLMSDYIYAADKYEVETAVRDFREKNPGIRVAVVRPCAVYGPSVDNYFSRILRRLPVFPSIGGADPEMQFVHEDDAAEVFLRVVEEGAEGYFHAVGEGTVKVSEMAAMAGRRMARIPPALLYPAAGLMWKLHLPLVQGPSGMLDFMRYRCTVSDHQTRAALGLGPRRSSREVVRLMLG